MIAICKTNEGFEDALTTGTRYQVQEVRGGSVLIETAKGLRWHGASLFNLRAA